MVATWFTWPGDDVTVNNIDVVGRSLRCRWLSGRQVTDRVWINSRSRRHFHWICNFWIPRRQGGVAGCRGINNSTLANVLPSCTETEHSQQEVLTLTQMSSPATTDTNATQHPDTTRPGNASKQADSAHKQPTGRLRQPGFTLAPCPRFYAE